MAYYINLLNQIKGIIIARRVRLLYFQWHKPLEKRGEK